jgi:hypothetical protein
MLPPNTVPITAEEANWLSDNLIFIPHWQLDLTVNNPYWEQQCFVFSNIQGCMIDLNSAMFRIAAHDYRHYFGDVVDLAKYETFVLLNVWRVEFLNNEFELHKYSWECKIYTDYENQDCPLMSGTEQTCKQWLIDHFTAIAAKDLPQYNLKFIFS